MNNKVEIIIKSATSLAILGGNPKVLSFPESSLTKVSKNDSSNPDRRVVIKSIYYLYYFST